MKNKDPQDEDETEEKDETRTIINEELVRWMTEGTSPNLGPRSDCG